MRRYALLTLFLLLTGAHAAEFPQKDIRLVVPFAPGGAGDTTSRIIVEAANEILERRKMSVMNRAGGGGVVGQTLAAKMPADGHTVLVMTNSVVTNPKLKGAKYALGDFQPVALFNLDPDVIAVAADSPYQTIDDLVEAAQNGAPNMVIEGIASAHHMVGLAVEQNTDLKFNYLPIAGFGQQLQTVMGNHADGAFWPLGEAAAHVAGGRIRLLAVADRQRDDRFPDVPTFEEAGLKVPAWVTFRGWAVPADTPDDVVQSLAGILAEVHESAAYRTRMEAAGYRPVYQGTDEFAAIVDEHDALASVVIEAHGLGQ